MYQENQGPSINNAGSVSKVALLPAWATVYRRSCDPLYVPCFNQLNSRVADGQGNHSANTPKTNPPGRNRIRLLATPSPMKHKLFQSSNLVHVNFFVERSITLNCVSRHPCWPNQGTIGIGLTNLAVFPDLIGHDAR